MAIDASAENVDALSSQVGWLLLTCAVAVATIGGANIHRIAKAWLALEDPRPIAAFRILITISAVANIHSMSEMFDFLFAENGLFTSAEAYAAFSAYEMHLPAGLPVVSTESTTWGQMWGFLRGPNYSLLYIWSSSTFFSFHLFLLDVAAVLFIVGFWTRTSGVVFFLLFNSIILRNLLFWEGTELVFRCLFVYLLLAKSGHAFSIDNFLRCRKERRTGHAFVVYRGIPAYPRLLMVLQVVAIYTCTGFAKTGELWASGDAVYYAVNLEHFYRFPPQQVSAILGGNILRVAAWVVRWWESLFFTVAVGLAIRWTGRSGLALRGTRCWISHLGWFSLLLASGAIGFIVWPVHETPFSRRIFCVVWATLTIAVVVFGVVYQPRPTPDWTRWFLGRRIWIGVGVLFQVGVLLTMSIGQFQPLMLAASVLFFSGSELEWGVHRIARGLNLQRDWALTRRTVPRVPEGTAKSRMRVRNIFVCVMSVWHLSAMAVWLLPDKRCLSSFRGGLRRNVAQWMHYTQTNQSWGMFAPNPPTANVFLKVLVTDANTTVWDLRTDLYAPERKQVPYLLYDRWRKVSRRLSGSEQGPQQELLRSHYIAYQCRKWARSRGVPPLSIELVRVVRPIPSPQVVREQGWDTALRSFEESIHVESCPSVDAEATQDAGV